MQAKRTGFVAVIVLAALVAGCGGSSRLSKAQYEQKIQADGKSVQKAVAGISGNPSSLKAPAVAQVLALARGVEADARAELLAVGPHRHLARLAVLHAGDREHLAAAEAERLAILAGQELQRQHAHHQQVRAVDPFVRLRDH